MLKEIILLSIGGFFGLGATVAGVAAPGLFPGAPSWVWYWVFWCGIALMCIMVIDAAWLVVWQPRPISGIVLNVALGLFAWAIIAQFSPSYWEERHKQAVKEAESFEPTIEALRQSQDLLRGQQAAQQIVQQIIDQYDRLQQGTDTFQRFSNTPAGAQSATIDRLTSAQNTVENIRALLGNVRVQAAQLGGALIIRTAPNTYRITFPVPMRVAPEITFGNLPKGVISNIIEKSNVGFTVIFSPTNVPVDLFRLIGIPAESK